MPRKLHLATALAAAVALGSALAAPASAQGGVNVGTLTCSVSGGWGFVFGSSRALTCTLAAPGRYDYYAGSISRFGVDIGYTQGGIMVWTVIAPTAALRPGDLAGHYGGATASATLAVGVGANVLVGGSNNSIALQPLSIETNRGLNVAAGIAELTLTPAR
ncbi:MAG TPA: DUF992 domain-containing protein [Stellaceae bacterium]|jgi:hypothetical protein|nr:DUF992 domain-containing protein [Stellaceae bacterium]